MVFNNFKAEGGIYIRKLKLATVISLMLLISILSISTADNSRAGTKKIKLNTKEVTLRIGKKKKIKIKTDLKVRWKSGNKKIATVNNKGIVKAKKAGTARITVSAEKDKRIKAVCKVKVNNAADEKYPFEPCMTGSIHVIFDHIDRIDDKYSYVYGKAIELPNQRYISNGIEILKLKTENSRIAELSSVSGDRLVYVYSSDFKNVKETREGNMLTYDFENIRPYWLGYNQGQTDQSKENIDGGNSINSI